MPAYKYTPKEKEEMWRKNDIETGITKPKPKHMKTSQTQPDTGNKTASAQPENVRRFKVNTGPRRNRYFATLDSARAYCSEVFARSNVVLSIIPNP